jgi:hypothetical protein
MLFVALLNLQKHYLAGDRNLENCYKLNNLILWFWLITVEINTGFSDRLVFKFIDARFGVIGYYNLPNLM